MAERDLHDLGGDTGPGRDVGESAPGGARPTVADAPAEHREPAHVVSSEYAAPPPGEHEPAGVGAEGLADDREDGTGDDR